jgi:hypothetical protein
MGYVKAVDTGAYFEVWTYEKDLNHDKSTRTGTKGVRKNIIRSWQSISSTRKNFLRIVMSNVSRSKSTAFFTFTFANDVDIDEGNRLFSEFIKLYRRYSGLDFQYVAVPEFQKRGSVHYHVLFFNFPKEVVESERSDRKIQNFWLYGYVDGIPTDNSPKLAYYMAKYMSKALHDSRLCGKKAYFVSRSAMRPVLWKTKEVVAFVEGEVSVDNSIDATAEFDTMYLGRCNYKRYKIKK